MVLTAFFGPPTPEKNQCRHLDGNKTNNASTNLAWGTVNENAEDQVQSGRQAYGSRGGMSKLTRDQVQEIKAMRDLGLTYKHIGSVFGVTDQAVFRIIRGINWNSRTQQLQESNHQ